MSLLGITEKIKAEVEVEISAIKAESHKKCSEIAGETTRQKADMDSAFQTALEKQKSHRQAVVYSLEKQRASMALQSTKRRLLDEVYDQSFANLLALPASEYVDMLTAKYESVVPKDAKVTSIVAPEARLKETEAIAKALGWTAKVEADAKLKGGCVVKGKDFEFDLSLERLFKEERSVSEIETANILFQNAK